ncbi:MAG: hypothetical protein HOD39_02895 [Verrucomicrobia bacterium]|nr:hypothetical protein [Verrucomicrobiota bacterium]
MKHGLKIIYFLLALVSLAQSSSAGKSRYTEPYPKAESKKGLQVELVDDALHLGIKHAGLNINLSQLIDPSADPKNPVWKHKGKIYHFQLGYLSRMDSQIHALSEKGVLVNLIVLAYQSHDARINQLMLHPNAVAKPPNRLCAFNTRSEESRHWFSATLEFMAERWSHPDRKHGRIVGYIIGNEVNSHWWWANMGRVSMQSFADDYLHTVRLAHRAIRGQSSWARVYISLEHHWSIRYPAGDEQQAFPGKEFLDYFARRARAGNDFDWHLAYHPYPENLRDPRFWNDESATMEPNTKRITFKNIEVLENYMERHSLLYDGVARRIIFSEQGFDTPKTDDGEMIQAAAYCYAYKKIESMPGIDAFILHRHVDHRHEGGLLLGLRRWDTAKKKKRIYECFRLADTPEWEGAFQFALPIIGLEDWDQKP